MHPQTVSRRKPLLSPVSTHQALVTVSGKETDTEMQNQQQGPQRPHPKQRRRKRAGRRADISSLLDGLYNYIGDQPLGIPTRNYLDWIKRSGKSHSNSGWHCLLGWGPGLSSALASIPSASRLWMQCDQLPPVPDVMTFTMMGCILEP